MRFKRLKKGFTLVELVVVIAVIAILSAVSVGAYFGITDSANGSRLQTEAKQAYTNIQAVALEGDENHRLSETGLHIVDIDVFEQALRKTSGINYDVVVGTPESIGGPTISLLETITKSAAGTVVTYQGFGYHTDKVYGSHGVYSVIDQSYSRVAGAIETKAHSKTLDELTNKIANAEDGETVVLGSDITVKDYLLIKDKNITLDLNGYTLSCEYVNGTTHNEVKYDESHTLLIDKSIVTITGNGTIKSSYTRENTEVALSAYNGSNVTIKNGTFLSVGSSVYSNMSVVTIEGGTFNDENIGNPDGYYPLNINIETDNGDKSTNFVLKGGDFYNFDVSLKNGNWGLSENDWIADGYEVTSRTVGSDTIYSVVPTVTA